MIYPCDLCGSTVRTEIEPGICACMKCGFVYTPERRSPAEIAAAWTDVYRSGAYDPNWPGVRARLFYVAEWLDQNIGLEGKTVLDIGAGTGFFLQQVGDRGAKATGLEPDLGNVQKIKSDGGVVLHGAIEDYPAGVGKFDIVTINWTLENCGNCIAMLQFAKDALKPGGYVVVATGSRIMVPYKKPYSAYFGKISPDLHCFRWSLYSLKRAMLKAGLMPVAYNDCAERDEMIVLSSHRPDDHVPTVAADDPQKVIDFFRSWKEQWA